MLSGMWESSGCSVLPPPLVLCRPGFRIDRGDGDGSLTHHDSRCGHVAGNRCGPSLRRRSILPIDHCGFPARHLVGGGILWFLAWISPYVFGKEGMGGGDIKLMAMVGSFIGWQPALLAIMIGALLGSLVGGGLIVARLMRREQYIPFGPFLAIGSLLALLFHESLFEWYWSLIDLPR